MVLDNLNRSKCVENLRAVVTKLGPSDYERFVDNILGTRCNSTDTFCQNRRLVIIDIVGGYGNALSQDLLVRHVLVTSGIDEEEVQRVLVHCVTLQQPSRVRA